MQLETCSCTSNSEQPFTNVRRQNGTRDHRRSRWVLSHRIVRCYVTNKKTNSKAFSSAGWCAVLDVALNPAVLQESKEDKVDITSVYKLALSFAQQLHGMQLSPEYSVVNFSPKSSPKDFHCRLGFQMQHTLKQPKPGKQAFNPDGKPFMSALFSVLVEVYNLCFTFFTACPTPASLISISSNPSDKLNEASAPQITCRPTENIKKGLIQVISTTSVEPQKPEYQCEVKTDTVGVPRSVELSVELPKVRSVSECRLQVSEVSSYTLPPEVIMNHLDSRVRQCIAGSYEKYIAGL